MPKILFWCSSAAEVAWFFSQRPLTASSSPRWPEGSRSCARPHTPGTGSPAPPWQFGYSRLKVSEPSAPYFGVRPHKEAYAGRVVSLINVAGLGSLLPSPVVPLKPPGVGRAFRRSAATSRSPRGLGRSLPGRRSARRSRRRRARSLCGRRPGVTPPPPARPPLP